MIASLALMCALSAPGCQSGEAYLIARAIDEATESDELRAQMVVWTHEESWWHSHPRPISWDARHGLALGAWQLWQGGDGTLLEQARAWLRMVQGKPTGLAGMCGAGPIATQRAYRRALAAERLLALVTASPPMFPPA